LTPSSVSIHLSEVRKEEPDHYARVCEQCKAPSQRPGRAEELITIAFQQHYVHAQQRVLMYFQWNSSPAVAYEHHRHRHHISGYTMLMFTMNAVSTRYVRCSEEVAFGSPLLSAASALLLGGASLVEHDSRTISWASSRAIIRFEVFACDNSVDFDQDGLEGDIDVS